MTNFDGFLQNFEQFGFASTSPFRFLLLHLPKIIDVEGRCPKVDVEGSCPNQTTNANATQNGTTNATTNDPQMTHKCNQNLKVDVEALAKELALKNPSTCIRGISKSIIFGAIFS